MTDTNIAYQSFLGFDVGKHEITVYDDACAQIHTITNKTTHIRRFLKRFGSQSLAVCEATGGYENLLLECLLVAGIPAHRADARKVKAFIRSFGTLAKTDAIDAQALSQYGRERHPRLALWRARQPGQVALQALAHQRVDMVKLRAAEKNRLQAPGSKVTKPHSKRLIAHLDKQIGTIDRKMAKCIAEDETLDQTAQCLQAMPGIGVISAYAICAFMPEIGSLTRRQAAALAAVAPHPKDSGSMQGYRHIRGGRPHVRQALFMAALAARRHNPELRAFYERLVKNGKKPIVAITAVMRKMIVILNAKVRDMKIAQQS
jgi:transposase